MNLENRDDECDENLVYLPSYTANVSNETKTSLLITKINKESLSDNTSLGRWFFDKKSKRKAYTSLNGRLLYGKQATLQFHIDKDEKLKDGRLVLRRELEYLMCQWVSPSIIEAFDMNSCISYDLSQLECWGIPLKIVKKYENKGFKQLFQWQIDCLNTNNGSVLTNNDHLVFSAPTSGVRNNLLK